VYEWKVIHVDSLASIPDDDLFATVQRLTARSNVDWMPHDENPQDWLLWDQNQRAQTLQDGMDRNDEGCESGQCTEPRENVLDAGEIRRPLHYRVQFTASQEFVDLLEDVRSLLGHERSGTDLPEVQLRALRALVKELRTKKRAATDRPREQVVSHAAGDAPEREPHATIEAIAAIAAPAREPSAADDALTAPAREPSDGDDAIAAPARVPVRASRHIPARVRRAVFDRDACRCAYRDERGRRCRETRGLEIHHRHAHALGGAPILENLELRCRAHNTLSAEQDFGREHMDWMRGVTGGSRSLIDSEILPEPSPRTRR
jgi:hypothetical protein